MHPELIYNIALFHLPAAQTLPQTLLMRIITYGTLMLIFNYHQTCIPFYIMFIKTHFDNQIEIITLQFGM